jgi:hypothetical protein
MIDFRAAWGSYCFCLSRDIIVRLGNGTGVQPEAAESLGFQVDGYQDFRTQSYSIGARLRLDGGTAFAPAVVELQPVADGHSRGTITISAPGWNVSGAFDAVVCPELMRSGS